MKTKFFKTLESAKNHFNKLGTPTYEEESFHLVKFLDGINVDKYVVITFKNLMFQGCKFEEIDIKL